VERGFASLDLNPRPERALGFVRHPVGLIALREVVGMPHPGTAPPAALSWPVLAAARLFAPDLLRRPLPA